MNDKKEFILSCRDVCKGYGQEENKLKVLNGVFFDLKVGESVAITGASGSGKSTLLHILGGLDVPDTGQVSFGNEQFSDLTDTQRGHIRNYGIGFVYQFHHLLHEFTALENVAMPLMIRRINPKEALLKAKDMLGKVGLVNRQHHVPSELSGGERQRVALARALVTRPKCLLADEPTGNLDQETARDMMEVLFELQSTMHLGLVIVTHDNAVSDRLNKSYKLIGGILS